MTLRRVLYRVSPRGEDELVTRLWLSGTVGVETRADAEGRLLVEAFFADETEPEVQEDVERLSSGDAPATDWLAVWRAGARPLSVGRRFLLDPREIDAPAAAPDGRILLRLPARAAFGTGSHESTRLVLEIMEGIDFADCRVLDVGTGTGVLAFAALALGARTAIAFDVDLVAPLLAGQNADLNGLQPAFYAGGLEALSAKNRFEIALVNVIPEEIRDGLDALRTLLVPGGRAVFSGILRDRGRSALAALRAAGFHRRRSRFAGEWVAYECEKATGS
jgi:ribosomal protein L11 methyltransferase